MKRLLAWVLALLAAAVCLRLLLLRSHPQTFAITHVTLIDGSGSPPKEDTTIIITGDRISAIGPARSVRIPSRAVVLDARAKFLIPGLADMHVHLTGAGEPGGSREFILPLLIANGITTVRDMGGEVELLAQLKKEINRGDRLGPQIFFTGPYLDGDPPAYQPAITIRNAEEARAAVRQLKEQGVDFVKVQSRLGRESYFAIADESRKLGVRFVGHVPDRVSAAEASAAGQASIEHLTNVLLGASSQEEALRQETLAAPPKEETPEHALARNRAWFRKLFDTSSPEKTDALMRAFAANQTWQVPTFPILVHLGFLTPRTDLAADARMKFIPANVRAIWEQGRKGRLEFRGAQDFALREEVVRRSLAIVGRMNAAGVPIMAGTDLAAPNVFPGSSLHEDLVYLVEAGLTPMQALQAATSKPAEFLRIQAEQGTISVGKRADLVLLDGNPLDDIRNTQKIRAVILRGKLMTRDALDELLRRVERFAAAH